MNDLTMTQQPTTYSRPQMLLGFLIAAYLCCFLLTEKFDSELLLVIALWAIGHSIVAGRKGLLGPITKTDKLAISAFLLLFFAVLVAWLGSDMSEMGRKYVGRFARFLLFVPVYFLMRTYAKPALLWWAMLAGLLVAGTWGLLEFLGLVPELNPHKASKVRVGGAVNPIHFGMIMLAMAGVVVAGLGYFRQRGVVTFLLALIAIALGLLGCVLSGSRGAMIFVPLWFLLAAVGVVSMRILSFKGLMIASVCGALLIAAILPFTIVPEKIKVTWTAWQAYQETGLMDYDPEQGVSDSSVATRIEMGRAALAMAASSPMLGVGPGNYKREAIAMVEAGWPVKEIAEYSHPHNEYLSYLATTGVVGLLALLVVYLLPLALFVRAWYTNDPELRQSLRPLALAGLFIVLGYLHYGLSSALLERTTMMGFYLIGIAFLLGAIRRTERTYSSEEGST